MNRPVHVSDGIKWIDDSEVIGRILCGEVSLYEILIRRYNGYLYKVGRSYGFGHEDTQDLMQETYLSVFRNLASFASRSSFKTWIVKIMLNQCYHKKNSGRYMREPTGTKTLDGVANPLLTVRDVESNFMSKELTWIVERALEKMSVNNRLVFTMRELNGMSVDETARALDLTCSNVKVILNRTRRQLRAEIEKMYRQDEIYSFHLDHCSQMVTRVFDQLSTSGLI